MKKFVIVFLIFLFGCSIPKSAYVPEKLFRGVVEFDTLRFIDCEPLRATIMYRPGDKVLTDSVVKAANQIIVPEPIDSTIFVEPTDSTVYEKAPTLIYAAPPQCLTSENLGSSKIVHVKILVDREGRPRRVEIIETPNNKLNECILKEVLKWAFTPALLMKGPEAIWLSIPIELCK